MNITEARELLAQAWPEIADRPTLRSNGQVCEVVAKDGQILGKAFSWKPALQQAIRPLLDAAAKEQAEAHERQKQDFQDFLVFLREKLASDFLEWKKKRTSGNEASKPAANPDPPGDAGRDQAGEGKLVQLVRG